MQALIDSDSKVNAIYANFTEKLGLKVRYINVGTQKIYGPKLNTFDMVIASFLMEDKNRKSQFFKATFLLAYFCMNIALKMLFLNLSNVEVNFVNWNLRWRLYITAEAFSTIRWVELIGKKDFIATTLDPEDKVFIVYVAFIHQDFYIYLFHKIQIASLKT